jgi:hypothetical protein
MTPEMSGKLCAMLYRKGLAPVAIKKSLMEFKYIFQEGME